MVDTRLIDLGGLQALIDALRSRGYTVIGPTVRSGAIVNAPISGLDDLPRGWGDEQDAAHRLRRATTTALRVRRRRSVREAGVLPGRRAAVRPAHHRRRGVCRPARSTTTDLRRTGRRTR